MAKNEVYRIGEYVAGPVPAPAANDKTLGTGRPLRLGALNAVQVSEQQPVENDRYGNNIGEASLDFAGAHKLPVTISGGPLVFGQPIYITDANALVTVATDNDLFGYALEYNVPNGAAEVVVKIAN